jgi:DNA (cytosine-5)-methyltransferase 1
VDPQERTTAREVRLLDLFCGQGGIARGYADAGFNVVGVDIEPQQGRYPFEFMQMDALWLLMWRKGEGFDVISASPPCQGYTPMANRYGSGQPLLIEPVRERLEATGLPYVIESVRGAGKAMRDPITLHGGMFGLRTYRPRLFESNVKLVAPDKAPRPREMVAIYGRDERSRTPRAVWKRKDGTWLYQATLAEAQAVLGTPWMDWHGVREAVPPVYGKWIGDQLMKEIA